MEDGEYRRAVEAAMDFAAPKARSRVEVRDRLSAMSFSEEAIEAAGARIDELGVTNDRMLAEDLIRHLTGKSLGRAEIERRLAKRGLEAGLASELLDGGDGVPEEHERALVAAHRKVRSLKGTEPETAFRRLAGHLARKGFEEETVLAVTREVLGQEATSRGD
jgi:regulatory protein